MITIIDFKSVDKQGRELPYYAANALDKHYIVVRFRVKYGINLTAAGNTITITGANDTLILGSGTWAEYGAKDGASITGSVDGVAIAGGLTINYINGNVMVLSATHGYTTPATYDVADLNFNTFPEAVQFDVNLVPSTSNGFPESVLDGNVNRFRAVETDTLVVGGATIDFEQIGIKSGGSDIDPIIERFTDQFGEYVYEIRFGDFTQFIYTDGSPFTGADSVKFWMNIKAFPDALNNGVFSETNYLTPDGQTGFFDEVFDAIPTEFEITSVDLTVAGDAVSKVDFTQPTDFQIKVKAIDGSSIYNVANSRFGIGFFTLIQPETDNWYETAHVESNTMLCSQEDIAVADTIVPITVIGRFNSANSKVDITDFQVFINVALDEATFVGTITPNADYTNLINDLAPEDRDYRLAVKVEDHSLSGNLIRPVWLTASYSQLEKYVPPLGGYVMGFSIKDHDDNALFWTPTGFITNTEDDLKIEVTFKLPKETQQIANDRFFQNVHLSVIAKKFTGERFTLEGRYSFELGNFLPDETQPISGSVSRAFTLPPSSDKTTVNIARDPSQDTLTQFAIKANYGVMLDWRYWIPLAGVSDDFFGSETKDWFPYQTPDWEVGLFVELETTDGNYENFLQLNHNTYDDWTGTSTINFYTEDLTPITKPIAGQITIVEAVHVVPSPYLWNSSTVYGEIDVRPAESQPRWMSSTVLPYGIDPSNPLTPLAGEVGCEITIVGNTVTLRTKFNPNLINFQNGLTFTSKIYGFARKGVDVDNFFNRTKVDVDVAKKTTIGDVERILKECCETRTVISDLDDPSRSDVTGHVWAGDDVEFVLYKDGVPASYILPSEVLPASAGVFFTQLNWYAISQSDGFGCFEVRVNEDVAGLTNSYTIENYELLKYSREITKGQVRLMTYFDFVDVKTGYDYTGSGFIDSVRLHGGFGWYQPNFEIENATDYSYSREKIRRIERGTYEMKAYDLSGKLKRLVILMLKNENICWLTDYNWENDEYFLDLVHVIVEESPVIGYQDVFTRRNPLTVKFREKLDNNISAFNSPNAAKIPPVIVIEGNSGGSGDDTIVDIFVDGVFDQTVTVPFGDDATFNISG